MKWANNEQLQQKYIIDKVETSKLLREKRYENGQLLSLKVNYNPMSDKLHDKIQNSFLNNNCDYLNEPKFYKQ